MAHLDWSGQIRGQLALPDEVWMQFRLPGRRQGKTWQLDPGHTVAILPTHRADGSGAAKYRPVRWHDWMREQTKPWRRPPDAPMKTRPGADTYTLEVVPDAQEA